MKFVKFSRPSSLSVLFAIVMISPAAFAQDTNYAPPPMFEDMTPPMVRPQGQGGNIVQPLSSPNTPLPDTSRARPPVITPRVSVDPDSVRPSPAPPKPPVATTRPVAPSAVPAPQQPKFMQPIIEKPRTVKPAAPQVEKPVVAKPEPKPVAAPAPVPSPQAKAPPPPVPMEAPVLEVVPPPAERDPKVSAITGPKTMPAIVAPDVKQTQTFEDTAPSVAAEPTIYERHQTEVQQKKAEETLTPVAPLPNVTPAAFEPAEQGILKKSIAFTPGQIGLVPADLDPISAGVANEINADGKEDWRVQIRAYATPYGTGLSSDRRIALNRALSLRTALITQGVSASRIDVLAEGLQSDNSKPGDRIDIYLYGPQQE